MQYGFVIDQTTCIGCHACTVACKAENAVPVGDFRTGVKYTEVGLFPDIKRMFLVQRCNHCTNAPCVTICPVLALEKRDDGIVDLDRDACIGCRACMQACPYDAIYLNEDTGSVEKCHFCAHRVEVGLQPACVNVCPTESIISGDFDDDDSIVWGLIRDKETKVRRKEQGTKPNVRYIGADDISLKPGNAKRPPMYLWSDRPGDKPEDWPESVPPIDDAVVVLDSGHKIEWGWPVAFYMVTKGIAAGAAICAPFSGKFFGLSGTVERYGPEIVALFFTLITCGLLVEDLKKPMRFYRMITRPNWNSWLVKGGIILTAFILLTVVIIAGRWMGMDALADIARWGNVLLGIATAGYTAFLFAQCKGRDLWEDRMMLYHLIAQAVMCGGVVLFGLSIVQWVSFFHSDWMIAKFVIATSILFHFAMVAHARFQKHATENARQAAGFLAKVRLGSFLAFRDSILIGIVGGLLLLFMWPGAAWIPALFGLFLYEYAFIRAGQLPPLS